MAVIFSDTFTEAVDTGLLSHTPDIGNGWSVLYNTTGLPDPFLIVAASGCIEGSGDVNSSGAGVETDPAPTGPEYDIQLTLVRGEGLPETGTKPMGIFARAVDANNGYVWAHYPNSHSNNAENIYIVQSGTRTLLASADYPETIPTTYKFEIRDAAKKLYIDGAEFISTTDNTITAAGKCGIFNGGGWGESGHFRSAWQWDDFSLDMVGVSSPVVPLNAIGTQATALGSTVWTTGGAATVNLNRLSLAATAAKSDIQSDMFVSLAVVSAGLTAQTVNPIDATNVIVNLGMLGAQSETLAVAPYVPQDVIVGLDRLALAAEAVPMPIRDIQPTFRMFIDWDGDGFGVGDEITEYVQSADISIGSTDPRQNVAQVGEATIVLDNKDRLFSPRNTASPFYGKLLPNREVRIEADRIDWPAPIRLFTGRIYSIQPDSQQYGSRLATIICRDALGTLQDYDTLDIPVQINKTPDYILRLITAATFGGVAATNYPHFNSLPVEGYDSLTIGSKTYLWVNTPTLPYHVKIGQTILESAKNLQAAINAGEGIGTAYGSGTIRHPDVAMRFGPSASISIPATIETSLNRPEVGNNNMFWQAQKIVMPIDGQISNVRVWIAEAEAGTAGYAMVMELRADQGNKPGPYIFASASKTGGTTGSYLDIPIVGPMLTAGIVVWIVFRSTTPARFFLYGSEGDFYTDGHWMASADAGATWTIPGDYDLRLDVSFMPRFWFEALTEGEWGNSIPVSVIGTALSISATSLTGGEDAPAGLLDLEADSKILNIVGGEWHAGETNGMSAVQEVVDSVGGLFWVARDGTLTYRSLEWLLAQSAEPSVMEIDNTASQVDGQMTLDEIANVVSATIIDRRDIVSGVVAQAPEVIAVPGRWGDEPVERWTKNAPTEPGVVTLRLPYVNPDTGKLISALSVTHPIPGTDYTINDREDGLGFDYTYNGLVKMSLVMAGGEVELTLSNQALGTLYIRNLQIRGQRFTDAHEVRINKQDEASIALYGRRTPLSPNLPFTVSLPWAESYASYLLDSYSEPQYNAWTVLFHNPIDLNGLSVFSLGIGDIIYLKDTQTQVDGKYLIIGIAYSILATGETSVMFSVRALDTRTYWILGDATYGVLGTTSRIGV